MRNCHKALSGSIGGWIDRTTEDRVFVEALAEAKVGACQFALESHINCGGTLNDHIILNHIPLSHPTHLGVKLKDLPWRQVLMPHATPLSLNPTFSCLAHLGVKLKDIPWCQVLCSMPPPVPKHICGVKIKS